MWWTRPPSLGVNWVVITAHQSFGEYPDVWEICKWAQDTYEMKVGLHTNAPRLSAEEIAAIQELDLARTRVFAKREVFESMRAGVEGRGIKVSLADPQPYGGKPDCQGARKLVFVDADGVLYTCGLVERNNEYRLGTIHEGAFDSILHDPALPHKIHEKIHEVCEGCDGCPSLIANFLEEEECGGCKPA